MNEKLNNALVQRNLKYKNGPQISNLTFIQFKGKVNQTALGNLKKSFNIPDAPNRMMSLNAEEVYKGFTLLTDSIKMITAGNHTSYVFAVKLATARAVSFQNLTIDESPEKTTAFITTYTPTKAWLKKWQDGIPGKFDGSIVVTPLDLGNENTPTRLNLGSVLKNEKISSTAPINKTSNVAPGCTEYTFYYREAYQCGSGNHWPGDTNCTLTGNGAAGYANFTSTMTICNGGGGGGGGNTTPNPDPNYNPCNSTPPNISFNGLRGERLAVVPPPSTPCDLQPLPPAPRIVTKEIINQITDPCLKTTINEAISTNKDVKEFIGDVINKFAGFDNGITINLYNGNISNPANTNPSFGSDGKFVADITFQNNYYNDVSKEAVVATLIHEIVHAYLFQTNNNYRSIPVASQHNYLFTNYVKDMADYLKNKYNMPSSDAWGLAWSGIGDVFNIASDDTTFQTEPGETMTKSEISSSMVPYKYTGAGSKGTPNCIR